ncbi:unnamed protein product [Linum tenue]|uniref:Uncharacterized protein n=1 Tax=Linum tenue TaxID=586396 RepID=A0AAV0NEN5_9ROSI|nr:unnamed protein product [Linum tenue]
MHAIIFMSSSSLPLPSAANSPATQTQATAGTVDHVSSASLPRTVWGNGFLDHRFDYASLQANHKQPKHEVLKQEVRKMVIDYDVKSGDSESHIADKLRLIDAVQRLGVGYHFEKEIGEVLERVDDLGDDLFSNIGDKGSDLYHAALRFRLLRQQGFPVSPDGFRKLKGSEGKFKEWLAKDEKGLLSLYEATHMAFNGEDILDELQSFATKTLESIFPHNITNPSFQKQIDFALRVPAWKCVPRSLARHSIDFYSMDSFHHEKLLAFAKLDFNIVQKFHQQELYEVSNWWRSIDVATKFPYARDRLMESYYCVNSMYFEPKYRSGRIIATKIFLMLAILDDTYDNFATYEEAHALTEAIERFLLHNPHMC